MQAGNRDTDTTIQDSGANDPSGNAPKPGDSLPASLVVGEIFGGSEPGNEGQPAPQMGNPKIHIST